MCNEKDKPSSSSQLEDYISNFAFLFLRLFNPVRHFQSIISIEISESRFIDREWHQRTSLNNSSRDTSHWEGSGEQKRGGSKFWTRRSDDVFVRGRLDRHRHPEVPPRADTATHIHTRYRQRIWWVCAFQSGSEQLEKEPDTQKKWEIFVCPSQAEHRREVSSPSSPAHHLPHFFLGNDQSNLSAPQTMKFPTLLNSFSVVIKFKLLTLPIKSFSLLVGSKFFALMLFNVGINF